MAMAGTPQRRSTVWSSSSRVLDDKWQDAQLQAHRARLAQIQGAARRATTSTTTTPKKLASRPKTRGEACPPPLPRAQSSAVKARQAEIERENLKMIRRIVELQQHGARPPLPGKTTTTRKTASTAAACSRVASRPSSAPLHRSASTSCAYAYAVSVDGVTSVPIASAASSPYGPPHVLYPQAATSTLTREEPPPPLLPSQSLHSNARQRHHSQTALASENRKLLQRILSARTSFSRATWEREERERRQLVHNISRFSYRRRTSSPVAASTGATSTLVVVDVDDESRQRTLGRGLARDVIRTGSPVTHLPRRRPTSASASTSRSKSSSSTVDDAMLQRLHIHADEH